MKRGTKIKLDTLGRVATELGKLYRDVRNGTVEPEKATKMAYILNVLRQTLGDAEIEPRLRALEAMLAK